MYESFWLKNAVVTIVDFWIQVYDVVCENIKCPLNFKCFINIDSSQTIWWNNISIVIISIFNNLSVTINLFTYNDFIRQTFLRFINYIKVTADNIFSWFNN